jgi:hypothetical protein
MSHADTETSVTTSTSAFFSFSTIY